MPDSLPPADTAPAPPTARRLRIHGRVQGVYFRQSTVEMAQRLRLSGWVRNRSDGSVEAWVAGGQEAVQALIAWAQRGPRAARVARVQVDEEAVPAGMPQGFAQRETL